MTDRLPPEIAAEVRDRCLCLQAQRAARLVARTFDRALGPQGLTNGQFSLLMALNGPAPPRPSDLVAFLGMDRATVTAMLKPLARRGLVRSARDAADGRERRLLLTPAGHAALLAALPVWRATHDALDSALAEPAPGALRGGLAAAAAALGAG